MGRKNNRKGRNGNKFGQRDDRSGWKDIKKENENWERYYKAQEIIPESKFEEFKTAFQDTLPLTFRVTGSRKHAEEISGLFREKIMPLLDNVEALESYKKPFSLPWYPDNMAYQIDLPKHVIKKTPEYAQVQKYLVTENEVGNISRQEAVSMIPPLVMDIEPHHYVLDMCAAPGSKTAQLIESLHTFKNPEEESKGPTGFVMANDSDYKRSYMLVHQIKRLNSANFVVVNHDAQMFPKMKLEEGGEYIKFDRILCDVPCTGDGTMRKNIMVWKEWRVGNGLGLHPLQVNILKRGLQLLKPGGRLVYSTCSLNPIENEAVIAAVLRLWDGKVKTVDSADRLPGLIRHKGMTTWKVYGKDMELRQKGAEDVPSTIFPPLKEEIATMNLEHCMRVYPNDQNTGGFFITVLEKAEEEIIESGKKREASELVECEETKKQKIGATNGKEDSKLEETKPENLVKQRKERLPRDAIEEPFIFLQKDNTELEKCWKFYDIGDDFPKDCTLVRNATGEPLRSIYYVSPIIKNILQLNDQKLKFVYTGIKLFISQKNEICPWRVQNECLNVIKSYLSSRRRFETNLELLKVLLTQTFPPISEIRESNLDPKFTEEIREISEGSCFITIKRPGNEDLFFPLWKGKSHFNLMVNKHETAELLYRLYGIDKVALDKAKEEEKNLAEEVTQEPKQEPKQEVEKDVKENSKE